MNQWEKEVQESLLDSEEAVLKELEKQYKKTVRDIDAKIRILQSDELTQSKIYQLNYQKALKGQIETILETLHSNEYSTIQQYLSDSYTTGFVGTAYSLAGQGMPLILPIDQKAAVRAVLTDSKLSTDLYTALGMDIKKLKKSVSAEVTRGISAGRSYNDIANTLSTMTGTPYANAKRIVRTEGHRIQQASTFDAAQAAKKKGADVVKQWDSILDGNTRPMHQRLDGQIREVDKPFEMGGKKAMFPGEFGDPAEDCNCRCVANTRARWALDEEELQTLKDRAEFFGLQDDKGKLAQFEEFKTTYLKAAEAPIVQTTSFIPAKTIEEAEAYAKNFVDTHYQSKYSGNISYKGMSIENANKMNQVLTEVYESYDVPKLNNLLTMNFRETRWKNAVEDGVAAAYQWMNGGTMFMNQKIFASGKTTSAFIKKADDLLKTVLNGADALLQKVGLKDKQRLYLEALKKSGVQVFAQTAGVDFAEATFIHESGHLLDDKLFRQLFKESGFDISASMAKYASGISGYAVSSNAEYIAESFAAFWYGKTDIIDPNLVKLFQNAKIGAAKTVASASNGDIISSVKAFAKGSKDFATVTLPKQEYAHVMSEIATNLTADQGAKSVFRKPIGSYMYTVENNGFGDYRIIGKELIDTDKFN